MLCPLEQYESKTQTAVLTNGEAVFACGRTTDRKSPFYINRYLQTQSNAIAFFKEDENADLRSLSHAHKNERERMYIRSRLIKSDKIFRR